MIFLANLYLDRDYVDPAAKRDKHAKNSATKVHWSAIAIDYYTVSHEWNNQHLVL